MPKTIITEPDRLLTPQEACERLGLTERQLRRQIGEGRMEVVKIGRLNRFRESFIENLITANTHAPERGQGE
jgi:excisionase family DNA binding protein